MKLTFELTSKDLIKYSDYLDKSRGNKFKKVLILGMIGAFAVYFFFTEINNGVDWATFVLLLIIAAVFYTLTKSAFRPGRSAMKRTIKQNPSLIGECTIEISEEQIVIIKPDVTSYLKLSSIESVEESSEHLFLFNDGTSAIIIPKRVLNNTATITTLRNLIKKSSDKAAH